MKLIRGIHNLHSAQTPTVATIGSFDGFHRGHQQIIKRVIDQANQQQAIPTIISFQPLPAEYFAQQKNLPLPTLIYPFRDKVKVAKQTGIEQYLSISFNQHIANLDAEQFVVDILVKQLKIAYLIVGDDFHFGRARQGNFALLQQLAQQHDFVVSNSQTVLHNDERISSTRIRALLAEGDIAQANRLLGQPYRLSGRIRHGEKLGRTIGFPTINLTLPNNLATKKGVYAVTIHGLDNTVYKGVANLGTRPSVEGSENRLEAHIFDYQGDVYGRYVEVELKQMLRQEQKFATFQQLQEQIRRDVEQAKAIDMQQTH